MLVKVKTGTILATGKTFSHDLTTTPDIVLATLESDTSGTNVRDLAVLTFSATEVVIAGPVDGAAVRFASIKFAGSSVVNL